MSQNEHVVFLVDDDPDTSESISDLLASVGLSTMAFGSIREYLDIPKADIPACLVLDVGLPELSGLDFQSQIVDDDHPPIVFITGRPDVPSTVRAMKRGAVDFLIKPFHDTDLLSAVWAAIDRDRKRRETAAELNMLRRSLSELTPREREVFPLIVSGLLNKQAAAKLGISEVTFQIHRGKVMQKMKAASLPDLVRMAAKLGIDITYSRHS
jgi:FixJ family two-component response regulator